MTLIGSTEDGAVIGSVTAGRRASRSAAMVLFVSVRARPTRRVRDRTHPRARALTPTAPAGRHPEVVRRYIDLGSSRPGEERHGHGAGACQQADHRGG